MLTSLRGLVLKSETHEEGETFYDLILGWDIFLPWKYKIATLYKDWRNDYSNLELIKNKKKYSRYLSRKELKELSTISNEELMLLSKEVETLPKWAKEYLTREIADMPERIINGLQKILNKPWFPKHELDPSYGFELQKVNQINEPKSKENEITCKDPTFESLSKRLSDRLSNKIYRRAFSVINILPH